MQNVNVRVLLGEKRKSTQSFGSLNLWGNVTIFTILCLFSISLNYMTLPKLYAHWFLQSELNKIISSLISFQMGNCVRDQEQGILIKEVQVQVPKSIYVSSNELNWRKRKMDPQSRTFRSKIYLGWVKI
jgi:hypothetical protein